MSEHTLSIPAEYVETVREAVADDVDFWARSLRDDMAEIREARERGNGEHAAFLMGDHSDHQRALTESASLVAQLPAPTADSDAELTARPVQLATIAQEAARFCVKALAREAESDPLNVEVMRERTAELQWWMKQNRAFHIAWRGRGSRADVEAG